MKILIFGSSEKTLNRCARVLNLDNLKVMAFIDNDQNKWNTYVTEGFKYQDGGSEKEYWPLNNIPIISCDKIIDYEFDFIVISTLQFAEEILDQLLKFGINNDKILLMMDSESFSPIYWDLDKYGNDINNSIIFKGMHYQNMKLFLDSFESSSDYVNNVIRFKDIILPLEVYTKYRDIILPEARDIIQHYYLGKEYVKYHEGPYEIAELQLEENDIVLDCGANVGLFTAYAALKVKKGEVYAFEPLADARRLLEKTASSYKNIHIVEKALSNKKGVAQFHIKGQLGNSTLIEEYVDQEVTQIDVEVDTIDSFVEENNIKRVDFIKADIEGAERNMLLGAKETIRKFKPKISICTYHLEDDKEVLEKIIKDINPEYTVIHKWLKLYAF